MLNEMTNERDGHKMRLGGTPQLTVFVAMPSSSRYLGDQHSICLKACKVTLEVRQMSLVCDLNE